MVCNRCIMAVKATFERMDIAIEHIVLGEVKTALPLNKKQLTSLNAALEQQGFEILDTLQSQLIEKVKLMLIEKVQSENIEEHFSITDLLIQKMNKDYSTISRTFSEVEGITIEQFFILQKIEKVKELLVYNEHTLSEIAWKLGYSSVQHLSSQFKKVTGLTPSQIKKHPLLYRNPLDKVK